MDGADIETARLGFLAGLAVFAVVASGCTEKRVIGEGQFGRRIPLASQVEAPLPRLAWRDGAACPGPVGGCSSFCAGPPASCPDDACVPLLIDSGTPLTILPEPDGGWSVGYECLEVRAAGGLLGNPGGEALDAATAAFRFREAPVVRAPGDDAAGWAWEVGDDRNPATVGAVIGGNVLRDFAVEFRHSAGQPPTVAFYSSYPGSEAVLADQGRAYLRLQYPGRLLGRLLNDRCEIGPGIDCRLDDFSIDPDNRELLFESSRALVDACVAPPPCALSWTESEDRCSLTRGQDGLEPCSSDRGESATLLVATGVPGLVLFDDSAEVLLGQLDQLPACDALAADSTARACTEAELGRLMLPGWPALEGLTRLRVRAVALVQGLGLPSGSSPCDRVRRRLAGLEHQCRGFLAEGRPVRPDPVGDETLSSAFAVVGEVAWTEGQLAPDPEVWLETLVVPATAPPVIALRREVTPEGAQPDGMIGGAMLAETETVLDFTEAEGSPGVRVRCLDPGPGCLSVPTCSPEQGAETLEFEEAAGGRTSCCFGLPGDLIAEVVLTGEGKDAPRIEDACCPALPRAALTDLQTPGLDLCSDVDLP